MLRGARSVIRSLSAQRLMWAVAAAMLMAVDAVRGDNAGFALAPRNASLAIDARAVNELLEGERGMLLRPLVEAFAGEDALATLDKLSKRSAAPGEKLAREVFAGRIAFFLPEGEDGWLLGFQSTDTRCEHLIRMFGAKMSAPGRFESAAERLAMRRVGGWLLVAPLTDAGRVAIDSAAARVPAEDAERSLIGDPQVQRLLGSDAPVRIFLRHGAPSGGSTTLAVRGEKSGFRVELAGHYDSPLMGLASKRGVLDGHLVKAFEDRAVMVLSNAADGVPSKSDAFWLALLPELMPPPSMRTNLAGERVFFVGMCAERPMPALACAWRVEDAEQAEVDQDHFMKTVCCGLTRAVEAPSATHAENGASVAALTSAVEPVKQRSCSELGPFADRFLGQTFKLGQSTLCWRTVATPCGGWQVYSSDPRWLVDVSERLATDSCSEEQRHKVAGIGFCDGPRAAALLRRWQPLVTADGNDRFKRGLAALSEMMERLGRIRFRYEMPNALEVDAQFDIEPLGQLQAQPRGTNPREIGAESRK